ncbi:MAG: T9SS type A sorting domain-containing protein [Bacteroidia bacterium]
MKILTFLFSFMVTSLLIHAQSYDVHVSGTVTDSLNQAVQNVQVHIELDPAYGSYTNTVATDAGGNYADTIPVTAQQGVLIIWITDCHGDSVPGRGVFSSNANYVVSDFNYCKPKSSGGGGNNIFSVEGFISAAGAAITDGMAYLITQDSSQSNPYLTVVDSIEVRQGYYFFHDLDSGETYYLKAALLPSSPNQSSYLPTYYRSSVLWANADSVVVTGNLKNLDISLVSGNNPGGPGFIGGYVSQGANKRNGPGDPVKNTMVILMTDDDEPVAYIHTDEDGKYGFNNLALGGYKLYVDIPGKICVPQEVLLDSENNSVNDIGFVVNKTSITTGIMSYKYEFKGMYPNPVKDKLFMQFNLGENREFIIWLTSLNGKMLHNHEVSATKGNFDYILDMTTYPQGIYLLRIASANGEYTIQRKVLKY